MDAIDGPLAIDTAALTVSVAALIAGITPPSTATKEQRSRASKDFIGRVGLASGYLIYALQSAVVIYAAIQVHALHRANSDVRAASTAAAKAAAAAAVKTSAWSYLRRLLPSSSPSPLTSATAVIGQSARTAAVQQWLLQPTLRRNFRIGCAVATLGGILRVVCFRTLGRFFTFELAVHEGHKVIQSGPYALVRHPSYTAILTLSGGFMFAHLVYGPSVSYYYDRHTAWYIVTAIMTVTAILVGLRIGDEERMLVRELGTEYREYMAKVRARIVPVLF